MARSRIKSGTDASIVSAPKQRNTKEENEAIKAGTPTGRTPEDWEKKPAKNAQKDKDARWTKKHGTSCSGYKNHVGVDKTHKLIRKWAATDASPHDGQKLDDLLEPGQHRQGGVGGQRLPLGRDRGEARSQGLQEPHSPARNRPLSKREGAANTTRSKVRARVEHVFGHQQNSMGGKLVRTIGMMRARFKIGMMNLAYNMRRLVHLERVAAAPA